MNQQQDYILAIDNGTQSIRALVFDLNGREIAKSKVDIEPYFTTQPGWAEQDADYFWDKLCQACNELWPQLTFPISAIKAVSITTQRGTLVNLDSDGKPLRPAMVWLDQRETEDVPKMGAWGLLFSILGASNSIANLQSQCEANWIASHQPEIWEKTSKFLLLSGYHSYKLTGDYVDAIASQVGYIPFDYKQQDWSKPKEWIWKALSIKREQLPRIVPAGSPLGTINAEAARQTGIPEGLPLIASGADKACEVLGSGCLSPDTGSLSYGTTATYNSTNSRYVEAIKHSPPYPAAMPNTYNTESIVYRGYWMVNWFKREFGLLEQQLADKQGIAVEVLFEDLLKETPAGNMGLVLQPFWSPGVGIPGPEAKGALIGFGEVHGRAHIYRAIIEGLAYALREGKERLEKRSGHAISNLVVSGGGSQSDEAMQITADIFNLPVRRPHTYETSALGAAINAAVGVGLHPDFESAVSQMTHEGKIFTPIAENVRVYDQIYREIYLKMYGKLRPFYQALRKITGYPR